MKKTTTRMLALALSVVMSASSFAICGTGNKVYAVENETAVAADGAELATPGDATPTDPVIDASEFSVNLSKESFVYDGTEKKPAVSIYDNEDEKLKEGIDYTCSYDNNIYPGTAALTVSYIGAYKGNRKLKFTITAAKLTGISASQTANSITMKWKSIKGATEYKLQRYANNKWNAEYTGKSLSATVKKLKSNSTYKFKLEAYSVQNGSKVLIGSSGTISQYTKPEKVTGGVGGVTYKKNKNIIESSTSNSVVIGWNPVKGAEGYIIYQYNPKTKKWVECTEYISTEYEGADKNKEYYTVYKLKPATGYKFKAAAYKTRYGKKYIGEQSEVITTATSPVNQYGYDNCNVLNIGTNKLSKYYRVELKGCSSKCGYYVMKVRKIYNGKQVILKTMKTKKSVLMVPASENTENYYYALFAHPYYEYGGKIYVNRMGADDTEEGNIRTSVSKKAGITRNSFSKDRKYLKDYYYQINKNKSGKIMSYFVVVRTSKKSGSNRYTLTSEIFKKYNTRMQYTGMEKYVYDKYSTLYYYNSKNKLIKYKRNVYSGSGLYLGYNIYNAKGKIIKKVRY